MIARNFVSKIKPYFVIAALMFWGGMAGSAVSAEPPPIEDELRSLIQRSELIARAEVVKIDQGTRKSEVTLTVQEVFKGDPTMRDIHLRHEGGKFLVKPEEPFFQSYERCIVFLKKDEEGFYRCVDGATGKKTIRNENVYIHPDNSFLTLKFNDYRKKIQTLIKTPVVSQ